MFGGPFGALIGGALGSKVELGHRSHRGSPPGLGASGSRAGGAQVNPLQAQQIFLIALISLAAKVAKADGAVSPTEVASFDAFLKTQLNMSAEERRVASRIFNEARDSEVPASKFAQQLRQLLYGQPSRKRDLITLLMSIAMADGYLHPAEEQMIKNIASDLGLTRRDYDAAIKMFSYEEARENPYQVLELPRDATDREIKKAYRKFARDYHPDVVNNRGLGEEFQQFAATKMRAVNAAYTEIRKERGF